MNTFNGKLKSLLYRPISMSKVWAILSLLPVIFVALILVVSIRGLPGNPNASELNTRKWKEDGPFELSPERGRFSLTYSVVEDGSVHYSLPIARFSTPDLGYWKGNFVSLFAPGISFITAPGYILGKYFGYSQLGTVSIIAFFAFLNFLLVRSIAKKLGASGAFAWVGAFTFLFATPAYSYAVSLYQHHISTFIILLSIYLLISSANKWGSLFLVWFLCALSIVVDYPNLFLMLPVGIAALARMIYVKQEDKDFKLVVKPLLILTFIGVVVPLSAFLYFNYRSYGNPLMLSGTVPYVAQLDEQGNTVAPEGGTYYSLEDISKAGTQSTAGFFQTRNSLHGFYTHFFSRDRGMLFYTPVILIGFLGMLVTSKRKLPQSVTLVSIVLSNIVLYSLWGDPWGGWAFGSRYLIPSYAILSVFVALFLTYFRYKWLAVLLFIAPFCYSTYVNTAGALTTNALPPQVQVLALEKLSGVVQKYTHERNLDLLKNGVSKSFVYNQIGHKYISAMEFHRILVGSISLLTLILAIIPVLPKFNIKIKFPRIKIRK